MIISSNFDGGNIVCLDSENPADVRLEIRKDNQSDFYQWFYFRAAGVRDLDCRYVITNAAGAAYQKGWEDYRAVASYDREFWFRVDTRFDGENLVIEHNAAADQVYFAYFAPYSMERHADLLAFAGASERCRVETLGLSLDGQTMDCLVFGNEAPGSRRIWIVARQHPGETMAEWWMEGLINRLVDDSDPVVDALLDKAAVYLVPNMNPDGSRRGHLRTNAAGSNLNREWEEPSAEKSPEVLCVLERIEQTGLDFGLDVHGDEALPYNFIAGTEGIPGWNETRERQLALFKATLASLNPDFQTERGYPRNAPGSANMSYCSNSLARRFGKLVMTLEMPFKDASGTPDAVQGWSPERCAQLATSCLDALHLCWDQVVEPAPIEKEES